MENLVNNTLFRCIGAAVLASSIFAAKPALADDWGAISIDFDTTDRSPYYGVGGGSNENEAVRNALKFCVEAGGKDCKLAVTYQQCGAYAAKRGGGGGWGRSATKRVAEAQAMAGCNAESCRMVVSDCN